MKRWKIFKGQDNVENVQGSKSIPDAVLKASLTRKLLTQPMVMTGLQDQQLNCMPYRLRCKL
eukprot:40126-Rhodomonas_salina.1